MSFPLPECPVCFGYIDWVGDRTRRHPLRKHLACTCEEDALTEKVEEELRFTIENQRRVA